MDQILVNGTRNSTQNTSLDVTRKMQELASQAVQIARDDYGVTLDFSSGSLTALYKLLDRAHALYAVQSTPGQNPTRTILVWGAYLGETIRQGSNGTWMENPAATENRQYSINTSTGNIFPMELIYLWVVEGKKNRNLKAAMLEPPTRKAGSKKKISGCLIIVITLTGLFAIGMALSFAVPGYQKMRATITAQARAAYEAPFLSLMPVYLAEYENSPEDNPVLKSKVLIVDTTFEKIADLHYEIPPELRASSPEEVNTVVQYYCKPVESGIYENTIILASRESCRLSLIDMKKREIMIWQEFIGSEIPKEIHVDRFGFAVEEIGGGADQKEMLNWLVSRIQ
ncbi:MAG: hypothetical protein GYA15_15195 [Leptolinea sp.]|jgi:hypothetical protein|nr:hypothetical protein [Leptolinea sp.]